MQCFKTEHLNVDELAKANHVHFGGFFNIPGLWETLPQLLKSLKKLKPTITFSLDTNYDASSQWQYDWLEDILRLVDIFLPNETEAMGISGTNSVDEALDVLSKYCKLGKLIHV